MNEKKRTLVAEVISALFILLFVYAAFTKINDFQKFKVELGKSPILNAFVTYVANLIPSIELIFSMLLARRKSQYIGLYLSFSLMVMFTVYIIIILKFSPYVPCSCGGILQNMTWEQHLVFNLLFIFLAAFAILIYPTLKKDLIRDKKGHVYP